MGLDNRLYGTRDDAGIFDQLSFGVWHKNWHLQSLLADAFGRVDGGGLMAIELDAARIGEAIKLLEGEPYRDSRADIPAFRRALAALEAGDVTEVVYFADW